jgi:hypothetical protein
MWRIVRHHAPGHPDQWAWKRIELGRVAAESRRTFKSVGQALLDAERHGFNPTIHRCDITEGDADDRIGV